MQARLLSLATLPLLAAGFSPSVDTIEFKPRAGIELRKSFSVSGETEQEISSEDMEYSATKSHLAKLVVLDEVLSADDERATLLRRTYEEIGHERKTEYDGGFALKDMDEQGDCSLEDGQVLFEWDPDQETYTLETEATLDSDVPLRFDLDLITFLPDGEVDEGDEWELEPTEFEQSIQFMGGITMEWPGSSMGAHAQAGGQQASTGESEQNVDGELTLSYTGTRDLDGVLVAVISIEGEYSIQGSYEEVQNTHGHSISKQIESVDENSVEGELLWNVKGGHAHALHIEITVESEGTIETSFEMEGHSSSHTSDTSATGTRSISAGFERVDER